MPTVLNKKLEPNKSVLFFSTRYNVRLAYMVKLGYEAT